MLVPKNEARFLIDIFEVVQIVVSNRATARDVITHRNQYKISCKIHFRMANKTRTQLRAILEPQLQLLYIFCTNGYFSIWFILSLC